MFYVVLSDPHSRFTLPPQKYTIHSRHEFDFLSNQKRERESREMKKKAFDRLRLSSTSFASPMFYQIAFLIKNINKKTYKQTVSELNQVRKNLYFNRRRRRFWKSLNENLKFEIWVENSLLRNYGRLYIILVFFHHKLMELCPFEWSKSHIFFTTTTTRLINLSLSMKFWNFDDCNVSLEDM